MEYWSRGGGVLIRGWWSIDQRGGGVLIGGVMVY